jgi:putative transposase
MTIWRCYYHIVWATKNREPLIDPRHEKLIYAAIERKSQEIDCKVLAVNGMVDHVHVAVSIPPTMAAAEWVKNIKGVSSREFNVALPNAESRFRWQEGASIFTFGERNIEFVVGYIQRQKEHHANNELYEYMERTE